MSHPMVSLGSVAEFINGVAFKPSDWEDEGKKIVRIQNLTDPNKPFNRTKREVDPKYVINQGDLLVSWSATLGVFTWDDEETALVNQHIFRVDPNQRAVDRGYLRHMLTDALLDMERHLHGATMKHVNRNEFLATQIPLPHKNGNPDLEEQKRIAAILDKADAIRRKRQQALRLTDDFLRSVFLDLFGDPVTNPMGWKIHDLNYVIGNSFRNGLSPSSKGTVAGKVLTLTAITTGSFSPEYAREAFFDRAPSENQLVTTDTFLICRGNGNKNMVGIGVFPEADMAQVAFPDTMIACTVDRALIEPDYLQNLWSTAHIRTQIEAGARTTNGTYKVNQTLLGSIAFPLPPVSLQKEFSKIAKSLRSKAQKSVIESESSEDLFASLQQRAFKGEL